MVQLDLATKERKGKRIVTIRSFFGQLVERFCEASDFPIRHKVKLLAVYWVPCIDEFSVWFSICVTE